MDRASAIIKARLVLALAEHPDTPEEESATARATLLELRHKYLITDRELSMSDGRPWTRDALFNELRNTIGEDYAERVYTTFRIDYLLSAIDDVQTRKAMDGALAEVVKWIRTPRRK